MRKGSVDGAEWYLELGAWLPKGNGHWTSTANVTFFPKVYALVVSNKSFGLLADEQRTILRHAAADTLRYVLRTNVSEAKAATEYCSERGTIVVSPPGDIAALERAATPVYTALEQDPQTKQLISRIQKLKLETAASAQPAVALCRAARGGAGHAPSSEAQNGAPIPNGIYRKEITQQELVAAGLNKAEAYSNYGIHTLTLKDGRWRDDTRSAANLGDTASCEGPVKYSGNRVMLLADCGNSTSTEVLSAIWQLEHGELRFLDVEDESAFGRVFWGGKPWQKIG